MTIGTYSGLVYLMSLSVVGITVANFIICLNGTLHFITVVSVQLSQESSIHWPKGLL
jgi:hypothetical protein